MEFQNRVTLISGVDTEPVKIETNSVSSYEGDSGIIVGFGKTSVGVDTTQLIFDLHIPFDSQLRDPKFVGIAITLSSINIGDYFIVNNTCLLYTSPSPRDLSTSRMPSSA